MDYVIRKPIFREDLIGKIPENEGSCHLWKYQNNKKDPLEYIPEAKYCIDRANKYSKKCQCKEIRRTK